MINWAVPNKVEVNLVSDFAVLQISLRGGGAIQLYMFESRARQLVQDWASGQLALKNEKYLGSMNEQGMVGGPYAWSVLLSEIIGMQTASIPPHAVRQQQAAYANPQQPQQQQQGYPWGYGGSGLG